MAKKQGTAGQESEAAEGAKKGPTLADVRAWIQSKAGRAKLLPRNDPYWGAAADRDLFVGYRSMANGGNWIARWRDVDGLHGTVGKQHYHPLGRVDEADKDAYTDAQKAARQWLKKMRAGIKSSEVVTVADACREYVSRIRKEKGDATATDAEQRFNRTVYAHELGKVALDKLTTLRIADWRDWLGEPNERGKVLGRASINRTLTALKAALNLAVDHKHAPEVLRTELRNSKPLEKADNRRTLFLDLGQRRALLAAAEGDIRALIEAAMLTGARPGELANAQCKQFDARTGTMQFIGKTGERKVFLTPVAIALFKSAKKNKLPGAWLFDNAGAQWQKHVWNEHVQKAAERAASPPGTCMYVLRHSFITEAVMGGLSTAEVAKITGTSLAMIDAHYAHLVQASAERLARITLI
ncbi:tyrosine-type recombinase/integrase [Rhodanobacter sp. Si-c]|uniref:Tyrosine-type recombinase/integrase n=1 Tax=Rhodanobacter lycopersici TaxID=3162487 RepID=A0ABV3QAK6_9GAMM